MAFANTILAGAQKSGTTALCRFLDAHPHCFVSKPKESNFFSRAKNMSHPAHYQEYFRGTRSTHRVRVDATTTYMADPAIASRIHSLLGGDAKIIFILRSPVARSYSAFLHMLKRGHERRTADEVFLDLPDEPAAAIRAEQTMIRDALLCGQVTSSPYQRLYDDVLWNYRYIANSTYSTLVQNYRRLFPPKNILVLFLEELTTDVESSKRTLANFLNVDAELFPACLVRGNPTHIPDLSTSWGRWLEQARWIKRGNFTIVRPEEITASPIVASGEVRQKLAKIFENEVEYWCTRQGRDFRAVGW